MSTPNIRYHVRFVNTTQNGKKTPMYTIVAQAGYYPPMEQLKSRDGQISMNLMECVCCTQELVTSYLWLQDMTK